MKSQYRDVDQLDVEQHDGEQPSSDVTTDNSTRNNSIVRWIILCLGAIVVTVLVSNQDIPSSTSTSSTTTLLKKGSIPVLDEYSTLSEDSKYELFQTFQTTYGKSYSDSDVESKFQKFNATLSKIDERNQAEQAAGGSAVHGITIFSDMTDEEFASTYLNAVPTESTAAMITVAPYTGNEEYVSWEGVLTSGVHDQGYCGSCWAFSAASQIEADAIRSGIMELNTSLSVQQLVSCDDSSFGCRGGWTEQAYQYLQTAGGIALEANYPYTSYYAVTGSCLADSTDYYMTIDGYYTIGSEQSMIDFVKSTGTLSVCLDASTWLSYTQGVVSSCGKSVDHCVQIIGVDTSATEGYWKIRNSWGTEWGEGGYIRLAVGSNTCNIANDPTFTKPVLVSR